MIYTEDILEKLYLEYFLIEENLEHEKIRYFESHRLDIDKLPYSYYLEMFADYCFCLFRISAYEEYLKCVDKLLIELVDNSISEFKGINVYNKLLYYKALAKYYIYDYEESIYILSELIKIDREEKKYQDAFLKFSLVLERSNAQNVRSTILLLVILAGLTTAVDLLIIRSFYSEYIELIEAVRNILILASIFVLLAYEGFIRLKAKRILNKSKK